MKKILLFQSFFLVLLFSCMDKNRSEKTTPEGDEWNPKIEKNEMSKGDSIIASAIKAHGGDKYKMANFAFTFRNKKYQFQNKDNSFTYISEFKKNDTLIKDILKNGKFVRYTNGIQQKLDSVKETKYSEALNSVIYFATLPYKLEDAAVQKKFIEEITIKDKVYDVVEVTFNQTGGGKDYQDEFYYWVNKQTHKLDYIAYVYHVNEGGIRFREAYNVRIIDGITFQDYINYEAPLGTSLKNLPILFQEGKLKELSRIETENVIKNNK